MLISLTLFAYNVDKGLYTFTPKNGVLILIKSLGRVLILLLTVLFLSSCSFNEFLSSLDNIDFPSENDHFEDNSQPVVNIVDGNDAAESNSKVSVIGSSPDDIEVTVNTPIPGNDEFDNDKVSQPVQMEIKLFFADKALAEEGKLGEYGFVSPVVRKVPATSGILKVTLNELIKGPLPDEQNLSPVIPATAEVNKVTIENKVAVIDFSNSLISNHSGGTLGGSITMQALVFTAAQFESVDGVLVTVEGQPWDDGHFIWDIPIYEEELLSSIRNNE